MVGLNVKVRLRYACGTYLNIKIGTIIFKSNYITVIVDKLGWNSDCSIGENQNNIEDCSLSFV